MIIIYRENRAFDEELEQYENVGIVDIEGFDFAKGKKGTEKFRVICEAMVSILSLFLSVWRSFFFGK